MDSIKTVDINNFTKLERIDSSFFKIKDKKSNTFYNAKIIKGSDQPDQALKATIKVISIHMKLDHPAINKYIGYSKTDFNNKSNPVVITEFTPKGNIEDLLLKDRRSQLPETYIWNLTKKLIIIYGISSGISFLHQNNIVHRDLKASNILLDDKLQPKITGFDNIQFRFEQISENFFGTPLYAAPEVWEDGNYSAASDVYAFGMLMYQILTGVTPFMDVKNPFDLSKMVTNGERPEIPHETPEVLGNLIKKCTKQNPADRPNFESILTVLGQISNYLDSEGIDDDEFQRYRNFVDNYKSKTKSKGKNSFDSNDVGNNQKNESKCCLLV